jgi:hypothetical protein
MGQPRDLPLYLILGQVSAAETVIGTVPVR